MMKKIYLIIPAVILSLACPIPVSALDIGGYLENEIQVSDGRNIDQTNKLKLDFKVKAGTYFLCASLTGFNGFFYQTDNGLELNRAYLELYPSWGKATIGLQNIAWGYGYFFNLPDQFNQVNPIDPKGEKEGINAVSVKWNVSRTSLIEAAVIPVTVPTDAAPPDNWNSTVTGGDYGIKGIWNTGRFDFGVYVLKKTIIQSVTPAIYTDRRAGILELRGELGDDLPGVWAQGGWFSDTPSLTGETTTYISSVLGGDYTIPLGDGLYILAEYLQNSQINQNQLYFLARYNPDGYLTISLAGLRVLQSDTALYSLVFKYQLNENVEISGMANYYPRGSVAVGLPDNYNSEIVFGCKTSF